jgi:hypothetical protein
MTRCAMGISLFTIVIIAARFITLSLAGFALFAPTVAGLLLFISLIGFFNAGSATATQIRMIDLGPQLAGSGRGAQPICIGPGQFRRRVPWRLSHRRRVWLPGASRGRHALSTLGVIIIIIALAVGCAGPVARWRPVPSPACSSGCRGRRPSQP